MRRRQLRKRRPLLALAHPRITSEGGPAEDRLTVRTIPFRPDATAPNEVKDDLDSGAIGVLSGRFDKIDAWVVRNVVKPKMAATSIGVPLFAIHPQARKVRAQVRVIGMQIGDLLNQRSVTLCNVVHALTDQVCNISKALRSRAASTREPSAAGGYLGKDARTWIFPTIRPLNSARSSAGIQYS